MGGEVGFALTDALTAVFGKKKTKAFFPALHFLSGNYGEHFYFGLVTSQTFTSLSDVRVHS